MAKKLPRFNIERDPRIFARYRRPAQTAQCLALGLDLATHTGYALTWFTPGEPIVIGSQPLVCGIWDLSIGNFDSGGIRLVRLRHFLQRTAPDVIFFENVKYSGERPKSVAFFSVAIARAAKSMEIMGAFKGTVLSYATEKDIPAVGLPIQAIKRRGTGKSMAGKEDMVLAANKEFDIGLDGKDWESLGHDNVADALFCLALGLDEYCDGVVPHRKE